MHHWFSSSIIANPSCFIICSDFVKLLERNWLELKLNENKYYITFNSTGHYWIGQNMVINKTLEIQDRGNESIRWLKWFKRASNDISPHDTNTSAYFRKVSVNLDNTFPRGRVTYNCTWYAVMSTLHVLVIWIIYFYCFSATMSLLHTRCIRDSVQQWHLYGFVSLRTNVTPFFHHVTWLNWFSANL